MSNHELSSGRLLMCCNLTIGGSCAVYRSAQSCFAHNQASGRQNRRRGYDISSHGVSFPAFHAYAATRRTSIICTARDPAFVTNSVL
jgi:hypothetical protein